MRLLVVSAAFPPHNSVGAVRVGKLAKFLHLRGHDVRIVSVKDSPRAQTLPVEVPPEFVTYTDGVNINWLPELILGGRKKVVREGFQSNNGRLAALGRLYKELFNFPDQLVGWIPFAYLAATRVAREFKPDALYASGGPWSSLLTAHLVHRRLGIPWFAEFRDPWTDTPLYHHSRIRTFLERAIERRVVSSCLGLITASEPWTERLGRSFSKPAVTVRNGIDLDDVAAAQSVRCASEDKLSIVHTGLIHPGKRDPAPLFDAIRRLGPLGGRVQVTFIGTKQKEIPTLAQAYRVESAVNTLNSVPRSEALAYQRGADLLLLLLWDPGEADVYPAKLFEYAAMKRPILLIGPQEGVAAKLIRDRGLGMVSNEPERIANYISAQFTSGVERPRPTTGSVEGLERHQQFLILEEFLESRLWSSPD